MKKALLLLISCIWLTACQSVRLLPQHTQANEFFAPPIAETASIDTLSMPINAAQTSESAVENNTIKIKQVPARHRNRGLSFPKHTIFKDVRTVQKLPRLLKDSTELASPSELNKRRPVNALSTISLWTGIGIYALLLLAYLFASSLSGVLFLLSIVAALLAIITGLVGLWELHNNTEQYRGKGRAVAGLVLGGTYVIVLLVYISLALLLAVLIFGI